MKDTMKDIVGLGLLPDWQYLGEVSMLLYGLFLVGVPQCLEKNWEELKLELLKAEVLVSNITNYWMVIDDVQTQLKNSEQK